MQSISVAVFVFFLTTINFNLAHLFYAEVTDDDLIANGGGLESENEEIEVFYLPISEIRQFLSNTEIPKEAGCNSALLWFLCYQNHLI